MFIVQLNSIMNKLVKVLSKEHQHIEIGRKETCSFLIDYMSTSTKDTFTRNQGWVQALTLVLEAQVQAL